MRDFMELDIPVVLVVATLIGLLLGHISADIVQRPARSAGRRFREKGSNNES